MTQPGAKLRVTVGLRDALGLIPHSRKVLGVALAFASLQTALLVPVAFIVRRVFDRAIPHHNSMSVLLGGLLALGCYAASTACVVASRSLLTGATKGATKALCERIFDKLYGLPHASFDGQHAGELHSVLVQDSEAVDLMLNHLFTMAGPSALVALALLGIAAYVNPLLFVALLVVAALMMVFNVATRKHFRRRVAQHHAARARYSADSHEAVAGMSSARLHGSEVWAREARRPAIEELNRAGQAVVRISSLDTAVQGGLAAAAGIVVLIVGGIAATRGVMSVGALLGFYAVVALLVRQVSPLVSGALNVLNGLSALDRINGFLSRPASDDYQGSARRELVGELALEDVSFSYREDEPLLNRVDFTLRRGEHVALMGPNGAGKSTVAALLLGLRRPHAGRVLADGHAFDELDLTWLRRQIGIVPQEVMLIHGTVAENIAFGRADPDAIAVREAAEMANVAEIIEALPDGYDTVVGEGGQALSGGERQRVGLARALVGQPVVLVLDEPSNHLDLRSTELLLDRVAALAHRPAVLTITHDRRIAARADRVVAVREGSLTADDETEDFYASAGSV